MTPFKAFTGLAAPLDRANVDTDQIIPKQFLKRVERSGFGQFLFCDWRTLPDGSPDPDFVLNLPRYRGAQILLARENFGCGSSREHAPWALLDAGFKAILAPSFADIFRSNCFQNGMLPVALPCELIEQWFSRVQAHRGFQITVDLHAQTLTGSDSFRCGFEIDPFRRRCLLEGLDDIALTLEHRERIAAYERAHAKAWQAAVVEEQQAT